MYSLVSDIIIAKSMKETNVLFLEVVFHPFSLHTLRKNSVAEINKKNMVTFPPNYIYMASFHQYKYIFWSILTCETSGRGLGGPDWGER